MNSKNQMTRSDLYQWGVSTLEEATIPNADIDARLLFEEALQISHIEYIMNPDILISLTDQCSYEKMIEERKNRKPCQYIIGKQEFMGFEFCVNEHVLIPRQETEILIEYILPYVKGKKVLDLCTGSGCIGISVDLLGQPQSVVGVDISQQALAVAKSNNNQLKAKVSFVQSDLFQNINERFEVIISNPPYIESEVIETLMPEVKDYEPMLALDGTEDGLYFYRNIIEQSCDYFMENGCICFEIGYNQAKDIIRLLKENKFYDIQLIKDYAGLDRIIIASI